LYLLFDMNASATLSYLKSLSKPRMRPRHQFAHRFATNRPVLPPPHLSTAELGDDIKGADELHGSLLVAFVNGDGNRKRNGKP
jgi:hypothetical protein